VPITIKSSHPAPPPMNTEPPGRLVQGVVEWKRRPDLRNSWSLQVLKGVSWTCPRCGHASYRLINEKYHGQRTRYYFDCQRLCPQRSPGVEPELLKMLAQQLKCSWPGPFVPTGRRVIESHTNVVYTGPNTQEAWSKLAAVDDPEVRLAVANESSCPTEALELLTGDSNRRVAQAATTALTARRTARASGGTSD
jgi:hypothetical protein